MIEGIRNIPFSHKKIEQFQQKYSFLPFQYPQLLQSTPPSKIILKQALLSKPGIKTQQLNLNFYIKLQKNEHNSFLGICRLLLPQLNNEGIPSADINILDTIFYNQDDNSIHYLYTDRKRTINKYRNKNVCQFFLKRRNQNNEVYNSKLQLPQKQQKSSYIALLQYKDNSFIRINESEFKSIFNNPIYSNEKLKNTNNTHFIQSLPPEKYQQQHSSISPTIVNIRFYLQKFWNEQLFKLALKVVCEESSGFIPKCHNNQKLSKNIKQYLLSYSYEVYLYYVTFQIYAYISIHHNKKLNSANFVFVKTNQNTYSISRINQINISSFKKNKQQFYHTNLLQSNQIISELEEQLYKQNLVQQQQQQLDYKFSTKTLLQKTIERFFDKQNKKIKNNITQFVNSKFQQIRDSKDSKLSNVIFKTLNYPFKQDLNQVLNSSIKINNFLNNSNCNRHRNQNKLQNLIKDQQYNNKKRNSTSNFRSQKQYNLLPVFKK